MRLIDCPAPVLVVLDNGIEQAITFKDFASLHLDAFSGVKSPSQIRQVIKILDILDKGTPYRMDDAEFELLKSACQEVKYIPKASRQLISMWDAIDHAQNI